MKAKQVFALEFMIASGINCWGGIKAGDVPWPPVIARTAAAFGILYLLSIYDERLAVVLGGGFLAAAITGVATDEAGGGNGNAWTKAFGAVPPSGTAFDVLSFGANTNTATANNTPTSGNPATGTPAASG
jgi:hypothetical protein